MVTQDLDKRLTKTMAATFGVPEALISPDSNTDSVDRWDSIRHMRLILALEDEFRVEFSDSEIGGLHTFKAIAEAIHSKLALGPGRDGR